MTLPMILPPQKMNQIKKINKKKSINNNYIINKDQYQIIFWCLFGLYRSGDYNENLFFWFLICIMHGGYLEIVRGERCKKRAPLDHLLVWIKFTSISKKKPHAPFFDIRSLMIFWILLGYYNETYLTYTTRTCICVKKCILYSA